MTTEDEKKLAEIDKKVDVMEVIVRKNEGDCEQLWLLWRMAMTERRLGLKSSANRAKLWSTLITLGISALLAGVKLLFTV